MRGRRNVLEDVRVDLHHVDEVPFLHGVHVGLLPGEGVIEGELTLNDLLLEVRGEEDGDLVSERVALVKLDISVDAILDGFVHDLDFKL
jgi:hypothetical protein